MDKVTVEQTREAITTHDIRRYVFRECSICNTPQVYGFHHDIILLDTNCDCVNYTTQSAQVTIHEFIDHFNIQKPEVREGMWRKFIGGGEKPPEREVSWGKRCDD